MGIAGGGGPLWWMALSSAAFWLLSSLLVGLLANRVPERWLQPSPRRHNRLAVAGIRRWKRWIPDAGPALPGGIAKAALVGRDPGALQRLLIETRRAELVHAVLWGAGVLTVLWLPPAGVLVNLLFAVVFNLPCLLLQRFNRHRVEQCLQRARGRGRDRPQASQ
jgi:glycosyl-4,4'-diaponeurosporenoate acyltransferase